jgi:hypothetical protein
MQDILNDPWPFVVGLAIIGAIYFVMFTALPFLFGKAMGSKPARQIAKSGIVTKAADVVNPKPVFPFEFREVPGENAMAAYEAAKLEGKGVPVIIGGGENERFALADMMQYRNVTENYLQRADANPEPFKFKSTPKMPAQWPPSGPPADPAKEYGPLAIQGYVIENGVGRLAFRKVVTIAFIPAKASSDIPAYLKLGTWNGIPDADVYVALLRKWHRDYGAELVACTIDTLDIRVTRKPTTRQEALILAREQLKFCEINGITRVEMADGLMASDWWHFYWD